MNIRKAGTAVLDGVSGLFVDDQRQTVGGDGSNSLSTAAVAAC